MSSTVTGPLPLSQVFNFRDLGGHRTAEGARIRSGRVFRADGLHRLVPADAELLASLTLRTVIDLRTDGEVAEWGHAPVEVTGAEVRHLAVLRSTWDREAVDHATDAAVFLAERYREMLDEGAEALAQVLRLAADPGRHGLVFHCAAGKDRTGVAAALILGLCGVADEDLAADYAATAPAVARMRDWYHENHPERREVMASQPPAFMACPPEAMLGFLARVRADFGSIEGLARDHLGLSAVELDELRRVLVG